MLLKLRSYRSSRVYDRNVGKVTSRLRYDFALRRVVSKLTLYNASRWAEGQKQRLAGEKMTSLAKMRGMRSLQAAPDLQ